MRGRALRIAAGGALAALVGCRSPTQITVEVSTNVPCGSWQGTAIAVGQLGPALEAKPATTTSTHCDSSGHLGTLVAIPSGVDSASVAFRVVGAVSPQTLEACTADAGAGCIVARRALNFIPHAGLSLAVPLFSKCEGVTCDPFTTCVAGECRPATIPNPGQCGSQTCGEGALPLPDGGGADGGGLDATTPKDGGTPLDATLRDGEGSDAASDVEAPPPLDAAAYDVLAAGCGEGCALSVGDLFTCVTREGGVWCWGQNDLGECGNGNNTPSVAPPGAVVTGGGPLSGVSGIVSGSDTSCAFVTGGSVSCWGGGSPLGVPGDNLNATTVAALAGAPLVAIGRYHMCWGSGAGLSCECQSGCANGSEVQAYDGDGGVTAAPLALPPGAPPLRQLVTTATFTCVLALDGTVYCLGQNGANQSDPGTTTPNLVTSFTPLPFDAGPALEVAGRALTACLRTAGHVYCWGEGIKGQNGGGPSAPETNIYEVTYSSGAPIVAAMQLAAGESHVCALLGTGQVVCWGNNANNELGRGSTDGGFTNTAGFVVDADGGTFGGAAVLRAGYAHTCAVKTDGSVWCWGYNSDQQALPGGGPDVPTPAKVF